MTEEPNDLAEPTFQVESLPEEDWPDTPLSEFIQSSIDTGSIVLSHVIGEDESAIAIIFAGDPDHVELFREELYRAIKRYQDC